MQDNNNNGKTVISGGVAVSDLLGVAFVVLKLVGVIDWSWWLILLPLYGPVALCLIIAVVILIAANF